MIDLLYSLQIDYYSNHCIGWCGDHSVSMQPTKTEPLHAYIDSFFYVFGLIWISIFACWNIALILSGQLAWGEMHAFAQSGDV